MVAQIISIASLRATTPAGLGVNFTAFVIDGKSAEMEEK
jgi:hypothetical protein